MAKSLLIDKLIDCEGLNPQEERFIRSLIKIKLLNPDPGNVIVFEVKVTKNESKKIYTLSSKKEWLRVKNDVYRKIIISLIYANELMSQKYQQGIKNREIYLNNKIGITTLDNQKAAKEVVMYSVPMGGNLTYSIFICGRELSSIKLSHLYRLLLDSYGK